MKPIVAIPAYSRARSLKRLLDSVHEASRCGNTSFKVLISLEGGASESVRATANQFASLSDLEVEVVSQPNRLGLRKHILWCGDLSQTYGSVAVLEDDLLVDPHFYSYASHALEFFESDPKAAGIALYAPQFNEFAMLPFRPLNGGYSAYPMQTACSWGQCWSASQWSRFRKWYSNSSADQIAKNPKLPARVAAWSESSWKKYFACFLVETGASFVYPYQGYSTNCADEGGFHNQQGTSVHQIDLALPSRPSPDFSFVRVDDSLVRYDSFMEQCGEEVLSSFGLEGSTVLDLYGLKPLELLDEASVVATCRAMKKYDARFPFRFRPIEQNLRFPCVNEGSGPIYLGRPSEIQKSSALPMNLATLTYLSGFNLALRRPLTGMTREIPKAWLSLLRKKLKI